MEYRKSIAPGTVLGGGSLVCLAAYIILQILSRTINSPYCDIPPRFRVDESLIVGLLLFSLLFSALGLGVEIVRRIIASFEKMGFTGNIRLPLIALLLVVFGFLCGPDLHFPNHVLPVGNIN